MLPFSASAVHAAIAENRPGNIRLCNRISYRVNALNDPTPCSAPYPAFARNDQGPMMIGVSVKPELIKRRATC